LLEELFRHGTMPDVITMQEVDHYQDWFRPVLEGLGYSGCFVAKPNSPCRQSLNPSLEDGCALFWRREAFALRHVESISYGAARGRAWATNQVALVAELRPRDGTPPFVLATTHLAAKKTSEGESLRVQQVSELLDHLRVKGLPFVLGMDMNAAPHQNNCADYPCQAYPAVVQHPVGLYSAYARVLGSEPDYTTWKRRGELEAKHTIDYILTSGAIAVERVLAAPPEHQLAPERLPGWRYPSDHVALLAELRVPTAQPCGPFGPYAHQHLRGCPPQAFATLYAKFPIHPGATVAAAEREAQKHPQILPFVTYYRNYMDSASSGQLSCMHARFPAANNVAEMRISGPEVLSGVMPHFGLYYCKHVLRSGMSSLEPLYPRFRRTAVIEAARPQQASLLHCAFWLYYKRHLIPTSSTAMKGIYNRFRRKPKRKPPPRRPQEPLMSLSFFLYYNRYMIPGTTAGLGGVLEKFGHMGKGRPAGAAAGGQAARQQALLAPPSVAIAVPPTPMAAPGAPGTFGPWVAPPGSPMAAPGPPPLPDRATELHDPDLIDAPSISRATTAAAPEPSLPPPPTPGGRPGLEPVFPPALEDDEDSGEALRRRAREDLLALDEQTLQAAMPSPKALSAALAKRARDQLLAAAALKMRAREQLLALDEQTLEAMRPSSQERAREQLSAAAALKARAQEQLSALDAESLRAATPSGQDPTSALKMLAREQLLALDAETLRDAMPSGQEQEQLRAAAELQKHVPEQPVGMLRRRSLERLLAAGPETLKAAMPKALAAEPERGGGVDEASPALPSEAELRMKEEQEREQALGKSLPPVPEAPETPEVPGTPMKGLPPARKAPPPLTEFDRTGGSLGTPLTRQATPGPQTLKLTIVGARGLRCADWSFIGQGTSDPYCVCAIQRQPKLSRVTTPTIMNNVNPLWNHEAEIPNWTPGDALVFNVYDKDWGKSDDFLGTATLESERFFPSGFDGEVPLEQAGKGIKAFLKLKIQPAAEAVPLR